MPPLSRRVRTLRSASGSGALKRRPRSSRCLSSRGTSLSMFCWCPNNNPNAIYLQAISGKETETENLRTGFGAAALSAAFVAPVSPPATRADEMLLRKLRFKRLLADNHHARATEVYQGKWIPPARRDGNNLCAGNQRAYFRGPARETSIGLKPIVNAGEAGSREKSPCSGSRNRGGATIECWSCPRCCQALSGHFEN